MNIQENRSDGVASYCRSMCVALRKRRSLGRSPATVAGDRCWRPSLATVAGDLRWQPSPATLADDHRWRQSPVAIADDRRSVIVRGPLYAYTFTNGTHCMN